MSYDVPPKFATQEDVEAKGKEFLANNQELMTNLAKQEETDKLRDLLSSNAGVVPDMIVVPPNSPLSPAVTQESTAEEQKVLPELVFNNLAKRLLAHSSQLSKTQATQALRHAILFPLEHERLPKLKGKHTKLTFQIAVRMFDAKLLMFYNYMKQAETSTVEDIDKLIGQLNEKRAALVEMESKEKAPEEKNG